MATTKNSGLQIIFSFFLGLMITAFIGVGVWTFYPSPAEDIQDRIDELYQQRESIAGFKSPDDMSSSDEKKVKELDAEIAELQRDMDDQMEPWGRNTSIILVTFATLIMSISLIRAEQLRVISNGLLLGGVFTMLYGTGWSIATGTSYVRFGVITAATIITIGLGYARFVREKQATPVVAGEATANATSAVGDAAFQQLSQRVERLEAKLDATADLLRSGD